MIIIREETNQSIDINLNDYDVRMYDDKEELMFFENNKVYYIGGINDYTWNALKQMKSDDLHTIANEGIEKIIPHN